MTKGRSSDESATYTQDKNIGILKVHESGTEVTDLVREHDIFDGKFLPLQEQVRWYGNSRSQALKGTRDGKCQVEEIARRGEVGQGYFEGCCSKKVLKPAARQAPGRP